MALSADNPGYDVGRAASACANGLVDPVTAAPTGERCGEEGRLCEACLAQETARQLDAAGGFERFDRELAERRAGEQARDRGWTIRRADLGGRFGSVIWT